MSLPVIAIRPEPGCAATVEKGRALGLDVRGHPLFAIEPSPWDPPPADEIDALLLGSANALRHAGPALAEVGDKPVYAVGEATADAARAAGLTVVATGEGRLQGVLDRISPPVRLLRLTGEEHVPVTPPPGVTVITRIGYASEPLPMPPGLLATLGQGAVVLLHSAAAARHFAAECDRHRVPRGGVSLATLGPRISQAAGEGWRTVHAARTPDEAALLALAADLCHVPPRGEGA